MASMCYCALSREGKFDTTQSQRPVQEAKPKEVLSESCQELAEDEPWSSRRAGLIHARLNVHGAPRSQQADGVPSGGLEREGEPPMRELENGTG